VISTNRLTPYLSEDRVSSYYHGLVIVDDYSCYSLVFFLERKDEVFEDFWSLTLRLNNEHPNYLKAIHSDNGIEFRNASFKLFCLEHGVDQQFSTPHVPPQNSFALSMVLISSFLPHMCLNGIELWNKRTAL
jgi:transposase InsO family protein